MKAILYIFVCALGLLLFIIGNYIYNTNLHIIAKVGVSELCFIILYSVIDKFNVKYGTKFSLSLLIIFLLFYLPYFQYLFYSQSVQYFSVSISLITNVINILLVKNLLNKGLAALLCSRISTTLASLVEVSLFAYLLDIGILGLCYTISFRLLYIYLVPKILFYTKKEF